MEISPLGDCGLILRVRDRFAYAEAEALDEVLGYVDFLRRANLPGVTEIAPSYTTIAVFYDPVRVAAAGAAPAQVFEWLAAHIQTIIANGEVRLKRPVASAIEIPVCYDDKFALDLDEVSQYAGLTAQKVIELHAGAEYRVHCVGFTPGFPYLSGLPPELATPRRSVPRKEVPAGSIAIGGNQAGIYPMKSPGGWNIIGRTPVRLFRPKKNPPALLCAGDLVRFRPIGRDEFEMTTRQTVYI
jgi:inhibitor of KinA